jgi:cyclopropane fatty-acyl-phospholipid synthase-like methyltransferase
MPAFGIPKMENMFLADGRRLPMPSDRFDYTVSCDVLEHVPPEGRQKFLEEIYRVTRPNGRIVLTAFVRRTLAFRLWGAAWLVANRKGGLPRWYCEHVMLPPPTTDQIRETFSAMSGKVLVSLEYQGPVGLWLMWLQNATGWRGMTAYGDKLGNMLHWGGKTSCMVVIQKPGAEEAKA